MPETSYFYGTGRRKTATARVRLIPEGSGAAVVNRRPMDEYFNRESVKMIIMQSKKFMRKVLSSKKVYGLVCLPVTQSFIVTNVSLKPEKSVVMK